MGRSGRIRVTLWLPTARAPQSTRARDLKRIKFSLAGSLLLLLNKFQILCVCHIFFFPQHEKFTGKRNKTNRTKTYQSTSSEKKHLLFFFSLSVYSGTFKAILLILFRISLPTRRLLLLAHYPGSSPSFYRIGIELKELMKLPERHLFFHILSFFFKTGISLRFIVGIFFLKGRDFSFPFIPLCFVVLQMLWAANYTETYVSSQPVICAGVMDEVWRRFLK